METRRWARRCLDGRWARRCLDGKSSLIVGRWRVSYVVLVSKQLRLFRRRFDGEARRRIDGLIFLLFTQWWVSLLMVDLQFRIGVLKGEKGSLKGENR
uniref:Candidate secreted effector n=1 Tax=Meloidogyne incognita TaxID=6306 RepID=A0A914L3T9_MELIC